MKLQATLLGSLVLTFSVGALSSARAFEAIADTRVGRLTSPDESFVYNHQIGVTANNLLDLGGALGSATATAAPNHLQASAAATFDPFDPPAGVEGVTAEGHAIWNDAFHVTVPDGFSGSPQLRFELALDGTLTGSSDVQVIIFDGDFHFSGYSSLSGVILDDLGIFAGISQTGGPLDLNSSFHYVQPLFENSITLQFRLLVNATADAEHPDSSVDFAQHSLRISGVLIQDEFGNAIPGATLQTDSGFAYQVPEPAGVTLGAIALGGFALAARRRNFARRRFATLLSA
jgi:hypothetical protein